MKTLVPLTESIKIDPGSHILYFYNALDRYIENIVSFIRSGIELGEAVVIADSPERYQLIQEKLDLISDSDIRYINNFYFYEMHKEFEFESVLSNLKREFYPYLEANKPVRFWGHVDWMPQESVLEELHYYECSCDITISELGFTTVCAYDSTRVGSDVLIDMLKSHEYMMTDEEFTRSHLYKTSNDHNPTIFPSLSGQIKIDSEMDLYKQKLDFVHVVSHEVRNPLTVINAYAKLLAEEEVDPQKLKRLKAIQNNVVVIDNEISHIIHTEEMLSTDALWQKKLVLVTPAIDEVFEIMRVKAETQNRSLQTIVDLAGKEVILSNLLGLKMILSNLISNAIKYSYEGTAIQVKVKNKVTHLLIEVIDQGVGMSEEEQAKLFRKYEKMNQEQSGQGIGLFMVKKLVDHFKGTIEVKSRSLSGSTFSVCLPIQK